MFKLAKHVEVGADDRDDARREYERRKHPTQRALKTYGGKYLLSSAVGRNVGNVLSAATGRQAASSIGHLAGAVHGLRHAYMTNKRAKSKFRDVSDEDLKKLLDKDFPKKAALKIAKEHIDKDDAKRELGRRTRGASNAIVDYGIRTLPATLGGGLAGSMVGGLRGAVVGSNLATLAAMHHQHKKRMGIKERTKHLSTNTLRNRSEED